RPRHVLDAARATAVRAGSGSGAGREAVSPTLAADERDGEGDLPLDAARRLLELELDLGGDVRAARASRSRRDADQVVSEEGGEDVREAAEVERGRAKAPATEAGVSEAVVEVARLRLREHLVGLDGLTEAFLRVGCLGDVGMELAGETAEGALDLDLAGGAVNAEDVVVVAP